VRARARSHTHTHTYTHMRNRPVNLQHGTVRPFHAPSTVNQPNKSLFPVCINEY